MMRRRTTMMGMAMTALVLLLCLVASSSASVESSISRGTPSSESRSEARPLAVGSAPAKEAAQAKFSVGPLTSLRRQAQREDLISVGIDPFQLRLHYDTSDAMTQRDEMMLLSTTQEYLGETLARSQPRFSQLILYQFVRDFPDDAREHFAKVAFKGSAYFRQQLNETDAPSQPIMQEELYLSLLGANVTGFVQRLRGAGMIHITNVTLMSVDGSQIVYKDGEGIVQCEAYDEDGMCVRIPNDGNANNSTAPPRTDNDDDDSMGGMAMGKLALLLGLSIPGAVLLVACAFFATRSMREIEWKPPDTDPTDIMWQRSQNLESVLSRDDDVEAQEEDSEV